MTSRWAVTILLNILLYAMLCWARPRQDCWLWCSQVVVLLATVAKVWGWYHWTDEIYNLTWTGLDLVQAWFEINLCIRMLLKSRLEDAVVGLLMAIHIACWYGEYTVWDKVQNQDGLVMLWVREWINVIVIVVMIGYVYYQGMHRLCIEKGGSKYELQDFIGRGNNAA